MKLELLLLMCVIMWCVGVRLSPMENNDKLQDVTNLYVAEWQWESWPVKQELTEQEGKTPGQRKNVALWRGNSKSAWYLFGGEAINGEPKKMYSDIWKFTVKTRVWKKVFPSQEEMKETYTNKKGAVVPPGIKQHSNVSHFEPTTHTVVLCGGLEKKNLTNSKNVNVWSNFRRKKLEEEKNNDELLYLAVYAPKATKSNTIWQIDMKKKFWTTYVCCTNTTQNETYIKIVLKEKNTSNNQISNEIINATKNESSVFETKINNTEDKVENEKQHLNSSKEKNKKKKINQIRKRNEKSLLNQIIIEKKAVSKKEKNMKETKLSGNMNDDVGKSNCTVIKNERKINAEKKKEEHNLKQKRTIESSEKKLQHENFDKMVNVRMPAKNCADFIESRAYVTWCDGKNKAFVTAEINSPQITLQIFNLTIGQWSEKEVIYEGNERLSCMNMNSIRYAGNEEEVYIICSQIKKQSDASNRSLQASTNPFDVPSKNNFNIKLVYRINYRERTLHSLGRILLNPYFNSLEGEKVWQNDTHSVLEVLKNSENETILILAYLDTIDLWILNKNREGEEKFELTEKVWRGSALKWFDKFSAPLYSLQFVSESGSTDTVLLMNPRNIKANEYWPRERGRFIIRVFRNENLKNQSFENRTRDQNLTYELLQSDYKPSGSERQLSQMYSLKVLVFFGISLVIFTTFGFALFLKRCVRCPPRIRIRNDCHKSPLAIRYSVIPDDLLYPVA